MTPASLRQLADEIRTGLTTVGWTGIQQALRQAAGEIERLAVQLESEDRDAASDNRRLVGERDEAREALHTLAEIDRQHMAELREAREELVKLRADLRHQTERAEGYNGWVTTLSERLKLAEDVCRAAVCPNISADYPLACGECEVCVTLAAWREGEKK